MAYGQKNYLAIQGINGRYRIDQIGCFITAFCNLLERYGVGVDPVGINNYFVDNGTYVDVDDGVRDDCGWGTVSAYDGNITVSRTGSGWPDSDNAIVKFHYRSISHPTLSNGAPNMIDHFCLVASAANHTIVDSWDGIVKSPGVYGEALAFAEYTNNVPQPVTPPAPEQPVSDPDIIPITVEAGWGITSVLAAAGYPSVNQGNEAEWDRVAALNGSETRLKLKPGEVINVNRTPLIIPEPAAPAPTPVDPPVPPAPEPVPAPIPQEPATPIVDTSWQKSTKNIADYKATQDYVVADLSTGAEYADLLKGLTVHAVERFTKDGVDYVRTQKMVDAGKWAGVPIGALQVIKEIDVAPMDEDAIFNGLNLVEFADKLDKTIKKVDTKGLREKIVKLVGQIMLFFTKKKK